MMMEEQYYRKEKPVWRKEKSWIKKLFSNKFVIWGILPLFLLLILFTISDKGPLKRLQLEREKELLQEKIKEAKIEQVRLQYELRALDTDTFYIEKAARERHNMAKEGETIYKLKKK